PIERVYGSLGQNRAYIDLAINLPFALLYGLVAAVVARAIWRRYPPAESGWLPGATMILFLSLAFSVAFVMVGDIWARIAETYRVQAALFFASNTQSAGRVSHRDVWRQMKISQRRSGGRKSRASTADARECWRFQEASGA